MEANLKMHNLIPVDAQPIVEANQLRVYCILHLAWMQLQQRHARPEEMQKFLKQIGGLIIS
jgi:hypothetical protein